MRTRNKFSLVASVVSSFLYTPLLALSLSTPVIAQLSDEASKTKSAPTTKPGSSFEPAFIQVDSFPDLTIIEKIDLTKIPASDWQANYKEAQSCFSKGEFGKAALWAERAIKATSKNSIKQLADSQKLYADSLFSLAQGPSGNVDGFDFTPDLSTKKNIQAYKDCLANNITAYGKDSAQAADIYTVLAVLSLRFSDNKSDAAQSLNWASQAVAINNKLHGQESKQVKEAQSNQAICLSLLGQGEQARTIINNLITEAKKEQKPDHSFIGRLYMNLALIVNAGVITSVDQYCEQSQENYYLARAEFKLANDPIGLFYCNYAMMRDPSGTGDPAVFESQWQLAQKIFPPTSFIRMNCLMQYALTLGEHRQYKQLEQVLLLAKTQFDANDPKSLASQSQIDSLLIIIYGLQKELDKAEPLVLARLKTAQETDKSLANNKPREWKLVKVEKPQLEGFTNGTIGAQEPLLPTLIEAQELAGDFYAAKGDFARAETYYRQCLDNCLRSNYNPDADAWFWSWVNPYANKLANCLLAQDKGIEAKKYLLTNEYWSKFNHPSLPLRGNNPSHPAFSFVIFANCLQFPANGFRTDIKLAEPPSFTDLKAQADQLYAKKDYYKAYLLYRESCMQAEKLSKDNAALYDLYKKTLTSLIHATETNKVDLEHGEVWTRTTIDELADRAQKAAEAQWGKDSPQAIDALELKALSDNAIGSPGDAVTLLKQVVALREKTQPNSEALVKSLINLARASIRNDSVTKYDTAKESFEKAEIILRQLDNSNYLRYLLLGDLIGTAKMALPNDKPQPNDQEIQKQNEQTEKLLYENWQLSDKLLKKKDSLWAAQSYASHLFHTGKQSEAIKFLTELGSQFNDRNDSNGASRSRLYRDLAGCYADQHDYKNAESQLKTVLDIAIKADPNWQSKPKIKWSLAELNAVCPKPDTTVIYGVNTAGSLYQPYPIFQSAEQLGSLYYHQNDLENARKYFELALEATERSGTDLELLQIPLNNLVSVLLKQNKTEEAKQYLIFPGTTPHEPFPVSVASYGFGPSFDLLIPGEPVEPPVKSDAAAP